MNTYQFAVFLNTPPDESSRGMDSLAGQLFEEFRGDVTPALIDGAYVVQCSVEGASLESAIIRVLAGLRASGLEAQRVELQAEALPTA